MQKLLVIFIIACMMLILTACCTNERTETNASWPYNNMIIFHGNRYVGSDDQVQQIDNLLGEIQSSSNREEDSSGDSFSNTYPVGTKLYKIKGINEETAIAVEVKKNLYIKAARKEK